ncbi:MAG: tripartite tricarboxylate transporter substrate binding protein [Alphaproteobacteria bacterium]|nr:MAG: tripartite tricarboxylate transporter substrate binding protein [Alphaproteobacteria bacterium]
MVRVVLPRRRALVVMGSALTAPHVAAGVARAADDWPNKPVKYINLFPAGGATDVLSRVVCQQLSEITGQQFVVENKGGSGGNVGADAIAKSPNDGYTLGLMSIASHAISPTLYSKLPFDAEKDFTPISMLWQVPNIFVVKPDIPAKTVPELVALVKASPGKYTFASGGSGTSPHICGEWLKQVAGLNMVHVPYRGGAPALQDLLAGQVDMEFDNIPGPLPQYKAGKLRGLAVTSRERSPVAPELPPMNDFYPGFEITSWGGLCGPAGLPPAMVEKASALCKKALESEALKTAFLAQGATPLWASPADAATFRRNDEKKLAPIIVASGAKVN